MAFVLVFFDPLIVLNDILPNTTCGNPRGRRQAVSGLAQLRGLGIAKHSLKKSRRNQNRETGE
jgi:hypothetical protein